MRRRCRRMEWIRCPPRWSTRWMDRGRPCRHPDASPTLLDAARGTGSGSGPARRQAVRGSMGYVPCVPEPPCGTGASVHIDAAFDSGNIETWMPGCHDGASPHPARRGRGVLPVVPLPRTRAARRGAHLRDRECRGPLPGRMGGLPGRRIGRPGDGRRVDTSCEDGTLRIHHAADSTSPYAYFAPYPGPVIRRFSRVRRERMVSRRRSWDTPSMVGAWTCWSWGKRAMAARSSG